MIDYLAALKRPFTDLQKYIIGILLSIIPIINFFALGYVIESTRIALKKDYSLPEWKAFGRLFVDGFYSFVIAVVYFIPALIIIIIGISPGEFVSSFAGMPRLDQAEVVNALISQLGPLLFLAAFLILLAFYLYPASILIYSEKRKLGHSLNISDVLGIAFSKYYPGPWLVGMLISLTLAFILNFIPYIGDAISSFTSSMILFTILAPVYREIKTRI